MTVTPPPADAPTASPGTPALTPLVANRAILTYVLAALGGQLALTALLPGSMGVALLAGGGLSLLLYGVFFRRSLRDLTASPRWRTAPDVLTALGAFGLGFVASRGIAVFMQAAFPGSTEALQQYNLQFTSRGVDLAVLIFAGGLLIPFVEELVFRGFALQGYERYRGVLSAALLTSVLFALVHGVPAQVVAVFPLGLVIARAVQFTRSFWTGVIIHALNNSLSLGLAAFLLSNPHIARLVKEGGGAGAQFGIGTGLAGLVVGVLALAGAFTWLKVRRDPPERRGPVWSASLLVPVVLFVLAAFGQRLGDLVRPFLPTS